MSRVGWVLITLGRSELERWLNRRALHRIFSKPLKGDYAGA